MLQSSLRKLQRLSREDHLRLLPVPSITVRAPLISAGPAFGPPLRLAPLCSARVERLKWSGLYFKPTATKGLLLLSLDRPFSQYGFAGRWKLTFEKPNCSNVDTERYVGLWNLTRLRLANL